jgi:hypothetical protein
MHKAWPFTGLPRQTKFFRGLLVDRDNDDVGGCRRGAAQLEQPEQAEVFFEVGAEWRQAQDDPCQAYKKSQGKPRAPARHIPPNFPKIR